MSPGSEVLVEQPVPGVERLWLNRPAKRNAIDLPMVEALIEGIRAAVPAILVIGSKDPAAFSSGADTGIPDRERAAVSDLLYELYRVMVEHPMPVIAAVAGPSVGGGSQIAAASDLRIAGPRASFRFVGAGHGLAVAAWSLPSLLGRGAAMDLCTSMRVVDADEALALGLVGEVHHDPDARALEVAQQMTALDPAAVQRIKRVVDDATSARLRALQRERSENLAYWRGSLNHG